ncbi:MAG TPA: CBS domain-containing protein [Gemmatimonadales bacterium]|nr:CBS domain-containing protein [Gemmatimonadales bacterium]
MNKRSATMPVHEVMTRAPVTVTAATTTGDLMALFERHDFNAFPVVDAQGVVRGIVTKLDVLRLFRPDRNLRVPDFPLLSSGRVADIMRRGVVSVEPDDPLVVAADLMVETRLHSLPVVQRKSGGPVLVGIVAQGDLLRGLRFELAEAQHRARAQEVP